MDSHTCKVRNGALVADCGGADVALKLPPNAKMKIGCLDLADEDFSEDDDTNASAHSSQAAWGERALAWKKRFDGDVKVRRMFGLDLEHINNPASAKYADACMRYVKAEEVCFMDEQRPNAHSQKRRTQS